MELLKALNKQGTSSWNYVWIYEMQKAQTPKQSHRGVLRNFAKFTGKHLCQSLFLNKVAGLRPYS